MFRIIIALMAFFLVASPLPGSGEKENNNSTVVYFETKDPEGDDYGPGSYIYPRNLAFKPYNGLLDLLFFRVSGQAQNIFFDINFKKISNPWNAPEGFIHPVIHIYLDTAKGGRTEPLNEALGVSFPPQYGWEYCLEGIGWESSRLTYLTPQGSLESTELLAYYLPEQHIIRLAVPVELIGRPQKNWKYFVLVGSYDGFGPGFLREIRKEPGDWVFGGGSDDNGSPRVIDLLAPDKGRYSQERQLSFPKKNGKPVLVYPINLKTRISWGFFLLPLLILIVGYLIKKRLVIFGFWLKGGKLEKN